MVRTCILTLMHVSPAHLSCHTGSNAVCAQTDELETVPLSLGCALICGWLGSVPFTSDDGQVHILPSAGILLCVLVRLHHRNLLSLHVPGLFSNIRGSLYFLNILHTLGLLFGRYLLRYRVVAAAVAYATAVVYALHDYIVSVHHAVRGWPSDLRAGKETVPGWGGGAGDGGTVPAAGENRRLGSTSTTPSTSVVCVKHPIFHHLC
uniref:Uncharacterized protein n=1 Tax=Lygus hesperus TaxID=30085 RepID=A0A146KV33_LYGHE